MGILVHKPFIESFLSNNTIKRNAVQDNYSAICQSLHTMVIKITQSPDTSVMCDSAVNISGKLVVFD